MMDLTAFLREPGNCVDVYTRAGWARACGCNTKTNRCSRLCLGDACGDDVGITIDEVARKLGIEPEAAAHVVTAVMGLMGVVSIWRGGRQCVIDVGPTVIMRCGDAGEVVYQGSLDAFVAHDPVLGIDYFVVRTDYGRYASESIDELVDAFMNRDPAPKRMSRQLWLDVISAITGSRRIKYPLYTGPYPIPINGTYWVSGVMEYPVNNWECNPEALTGLVKWVNTHYNANRVPALANVGIGVAKVYSPAIRMAGVFDDYVVINTGWTRIGKTLVLRGIANALGLRNTANTLVVGELADTTEAGLRDALSQSMAPLFLSDVKAEAVLPKLGLFVRGFTSFEPMFVKHEKHTFYPGRSPIIAMNISLTRALSLVGGEDVGVARRVRFIEWEPEQLPRGVPPYEPSGKGGLIGCMKQAWEGSSEFRSKALRTQDLLELAMITWDYLGREFLSRDDVKPVLEALGWLSNEWEAQFMELVEGGVNDAVELLNALYERARRVYNVTNMTPIRLARLVLEDPSSFGIKFMRPREINEEELRNAMQELRIMGTALNVDIEHIPSPPYQRDEEAVIARLHNYLSGGLTRVVVICRGPNAILNKCPREFMGSRGGVYTLGGVRVRGYALGATEFVKLIIEGSGSVINQ